MYCTRAVQDLLLREKLQRDYPNTFMEVIYEDFVDRPLEKTQSIYDFIGEPLPNATHNWLVKATKSSTDIVTHWMSSLTYDVAKDIHTVCRDFFKMFMYDWN
jgi:hypothetical protein